MNRRKPDQAHSDEPVLVVGANGQLGAALMNTLAPRAIPLTRRDADLTDDGAVRERVLAAQPAVVINAAAYTQVDRAESDEAACFAVNADAVANLADVCDEAGYRLVQISTDYVFGGSEPGRPHRETVPTAPQGVYARSKLAGEQAAAGCRDHLIVRTCGLYTAGLGPPVRGRNFADTMLVLSQTDQQLRVVNDQTCTPTYAPHLVAALVGLIDADAQGLLHLTNAGATNWFEFATALLGEVGSETPVTPISTAEFGAAAPRPHWSVLDCSRAASLGVLLPSWREGLAAYLQERRRQGHLSSNG